MLAIAHRGYSAKYPENTTAAFEQAIAVGADYIETDLRFSADKEIACCHDDDFSRLARNPAKVASMVLADIKRLTLPGGGEIMTLADVLALAQGRSKVMLDVKITTRAMAEQFLHRVRAAGLLRDVIFGARTPEFATLLKSLEADVRILAMPRTPADLERYNPALLEAVRCYEDDLSERVLADTQRLGLPLWITAGLRNKGEVPGAITTGRLDALAAASIAGVLLNDPTLITTRRG